MDRAGIPRYALQHADDLICYIRFVRLLEDTAAELARPSFGLDFALANEPYFSNMGPVTMMAKFTANFREWIEIGMRNRRIYSSGAILELFEDSKSELVSLRHRQLIVSGAIPGGNWAAQFVEHEIGSIFRMARAVTGYLDERPVRVRFAHPRPARTDVHERMFGCEVEFGAEFNEIVFRRQVLDYPTGGNLSIFQGLMRYAIRVRTQQPPISGKAVSYAVRLAIASLAGVQRSSVEFVADSIGFRVREIRRLLAQEGTSFTQILDEVRAEQSVRLLKDSDVSITSIAAMLDYSGVVPFATAVRRWTGRAPRLVRRECGS